MVFESAVRRSGWRASWQTSSSHDAPRLAEGNHRRGQRPRQSQQQPSACVRALRRARSARRRPRSRARGSRAAARDPRGPPASADCRRPRPPRRPRRRRSRGPRARASRSPAAISASGPPGRAANDVSASSVPTRTGVLSSPASNASASQAVPTSRFGAQPADPSMRRGHGKEHLGLVGRGVVRAQAVEQARHGSRQRRNLGAEGGCQPQVGPQAIARRSGSAGLRAAPSCRRAPRSTPPAAPRFEDLLELDRGTWGRQPTAATDGAR